MRLIVRNRRRKEIGAISIEAALTGGLLLFLVLGAIGYTHRLSEQGDLLEAARVGARAAARCQEGLNRAGAVGMDAARRHLASLGRSPQRYDFEVRTAQRRYGGMRQPIPTVAVAIQTKRLPGGALPAAAVCAADFARLEKGHWVADARLAGAYVDCLQTL